MEIWENVNLDGCRDNYKISTNGIVKSIKRKCFIKNSNKWRTVPEKILSLKEDKDGYLCLHLSSNIKNWYGSLHRLLALTFIPNPLNLPQVNHKDGNKLNNKLENLEWVTAKQNIQHAVDTGLNISVKGEKRAFAKMTDKLVLEARKRYKEENISLVKLAKDYSISPQTLHDIVKGNKWKHLPI